MSWYRWIIGKWRMFWNLCPQCNSDAPEIDTCTVCMGFRSSFDYEADYEAWWKTYKLIHTKYKK